MSTPTPLTPSARAGIIFDMDGLLLDSERIARIAWRQAATLAGYQMTDPLFASLVGRREPDSSEILNRAFGPRFDFAKTNAHCNRIYQEHLAEHGLPLKQGAREIGAAFSARNIPLAVATSTRNPLARLRLEQAGLLAYFQVVVGGNEVAHGKPAPDIYQEAARRLGIDPASSFALEDSPAGVQAAHAAGLRVIMVPDLIPATPELRALVDQVCASLPEAQAYLERNGF